MAKRDSALRGEGVTFPAGKEVYKTGTDPVWGVGVEVLVDDRDGATDAVAGVLWDDSGKAELDDLIGALPTTEFETSAIEAILKSDELDVDSWRVGEATAQAHLEANASCSFPWNPRRDLKNPLASPAGAELVGFDKRVDPPRLALGEVKTSAQEAWPPSVVYGDDGLQKQLANSRDRRGIAENLLRWLGMRASETVWIEDYRASVKRFLTDPKDLSIFGILVRTVSPDEADLRSTADGLASGTAEPVSIELAALYVESAWLSDLASPPGEAEV